MSGVFEYLALHIFLLKGYTCENTRAILFEKAESTYECMLTIQVNVESPAALLSQQSIMSCAKETLEAPLPIGAPTLPGVLVCPHNLQGSCCDDKIASSTEYY